MVRRRRRKPESLFFPAVPEAKLNAQFRCAMTDPTHGPARRLMDEIWNDFEVWWKGDLRTASRRTPRTILRTLPETRILLLI